MSNTEKLKKWVVSGAAKPPEGETVETIIQQVENVPKPRMVRRIRNDNA